MTKKKSQDDRFIAIFQNGAQNRYICFLITFNMLLIITYILKIYYNSGATHVLAHNELFIEKNNTKISVYPSWLSSFILLGELPHSAKQVPTVWYVIPTQQMVLF